MLTKHDVECHICFRQPGIILDPVIFFCILLMIFKHLFKQSEMIIQTNAISRQAKCCDGIQKAGCQSAKSAVSKRWFRLDLLNLGK